jgi:hypothetical protein
VVLFIGFTFFFKVNEAPSPRQKRKIHHKKLSLHKLGCAKLFLKFPFPCIGVDLSIVEYNIISGQPDNPASSDENLSGSLESLDTLWQQQGFVQFGLLLLPPLPS